MDRITAAVAVVNGRATTTSLKIAEVFGKRHADVIRAIESIETPDNFNERNFALVEYTDAKGEKRPAYQITRDGFALLAMEGMRTFPNHDLTLIGCGSMLCATGLETREKAEAAAVTGCAPSEKNIVICLLGRLGRSNPGVSFSTFPTQSPLFRALESAEKVTKSPQKKEA